MASQPTNQFPRIAIIGAGPSGLLLALLLSHHDSTPTVYERDPSHTTRTQGGTLDLHPSTGQRALKAAGVWPAISACLRREGEDFVCVDKSGVRFIDERSADHDRPELDRGDLRRVLLGALPAGLVRCGAHVTAVREGGVVELADGTQETYDLVVGADGAWSKVRKLLTSVMPHYSGISGIDLRFSSVDIRHPHIARLVGHGSLFALSDSKALMAQRNGDGSVRVYAWAQRPEHWLRTSGIDFSDRAAAKAAVATDYEEWTAELRELITAADDDDVVPRALYMLPPDHRWDFKPNFTLVGDAAHLMTPFAGEGVNLALLDALELSQAISSATNADGNVASPEERQAALASAVKRFEEGMMARAQEKAEETWENLGEMMSADAPGPFVKRMEALMGGPPPS